MLSASLKHRLRDPDYLEGHLLAARVLMQVEGFGWYDSQFLKAFEAARRVLDQVAPEELPRFLAGFAPLDPPPGFRQVKVTDFFAPDEFAAIRAEVADLHRRELETHEITRFGRHILHDHPPFLALQNALVNRVSALAGVDLVAGYNFLSLYGSEGRCGLHIDQPISMFTLDVCVDQDAEWPIQFSQPVDWTSVGELGEQVSVPLLEQAGVAFRSEVLRPNEALLFCGSAQWHYRRPIHPGGFCNLLFFHYYPVGCDKLIDPPQWADHFAMPVLQPLCDLFAEARLSVRGGSGRGDGFGYGPAA